jgi:hypothetical protein
VLLTATTNRTAFEHRSIGEPQLIAGRWRDERLLAIARRIEPVAGGFVRPTALA